MNRKANWLWIVSISVALVAGIIVGYLFSDPSSDAENGRHSDSGTNTAAATSVWTCSMHPQVRQPKPGKCPICFMDLIRLTSTSGDDASENVPELKLTPRAVKMARIQTVPVRRRDVSVETRLFGKVDFNESLIAYITAKMPGRVERLYVDYTGISVRQGDHMVEYFSPELMVAQQELLFAVKDYRKQSNNESARIEAEAALQSVLKKFDAWDLTKENIDNIIETGEVSRNMTLYAPVSGIVIHKNALEGKYFQTGDRLFTIADLSKVWVMLEAYESDIFWLKYGQEIEFTTNSWPGETFKGRISFIAPIVDPLTRTVKVRVDASNPAGRLKPEMFVNAVAYAGVSQNGRVINPQLAGKWICPMHPSVIEENAGKCRICDMQLIKSEALGYASTDENADKPLVIPATAPLITGKRAIVYLAAEDRPGTYYGQEIVLGPRAGDFYVVREGLREGDQVVVNGNFKIDSALQIQARPSMMSDNEPHARDRETMEHSEPNEAAAASPVPRQFKYELDSVYRVYFDIQEGLAQDDLKIARQASEKLKTLLTQPSHDRLNSDHKQEWHKLKTEILNSNMGVATAKDLTKARESFSALSADIYELCRRFGASGKFPIYRFFCPMVFSNKGGYWLQDKPGVVNPYFGAAMLKCGEKIENVIE